MRQLVSRVITRHKRKKFCEKYFDDVDFDIISDKYSTGVKTISIADFFLNDDVVCNMFMNI